MADAGVASRRDCEQMIEEGRVQVNGRVVTRLPAFVDPRHDRISVDGRLLSQPRGAARSDRVYVMLNKPDNTLCTTRDDDTAPGGGGRKTVLDLVEHPSGARLIPIGKLDYHATGLVLLTNDGDLAQRLTHARYGVGKTYRIALAAPADPEILAMLRRRVGKRDAVDEQGRVTGGVRTLGAADRSGHGPRDAAPDSGHSSPPGSVIEVVLREGRTEPLAEMLLTAGCRVRAFNCVAIGPLRLTGVKTGSWRNLTRDELFALRSAVGLEAPPAPRPPRGPRTSDRPSAPTANPARGQAPSEPPETDE